MMSPYTTLLVVGQNQQLRSCKDSSLRLEKLWIMLPFKHFDKCRLREPCSLLFRLENPNDVHLVA